MNRYFDQLMPAQEKLIREQIASKFQGKNEDQKSFYTYDEAIDRYKLSLMNTVVKKGKDSEKAYTCLKIAWIYWNLGLKSLSGSNRFTRPFFTTLVLNTWSHTLQRTVLSKRNSSSA